jgi:regulator of cell morphogenesis and NO signaling
MKKYFNLEDEIGQIVTVFPGASRLFFDNKIDFCCGGNRPLMEAIKTQGLDSNLILNELNAKYEDFCKKNEEFVDWAKESPEKLVDYIETKHHGYLKEELPSISEIIFKILKVHGKAHKELFEIHKLYNALRTELEGHLVKEEEFLFPLIKTSNQKENQQEIIDIIEDLENEHVMAGDIIKRLRELTNHYTVPKNVCKTYELAFRKLSEFEQDIFQHIHLENNILFRNICSK